MQQSQRCRHGANQPLCAILRAMLWRNKKPLACLHSLVAKPSMLHAMLQRVSGNFVPRALRVRSSRASYAEGPGDEVPVNEINMTGAVWPRFISLPFTACILQIPSSGMRCTDSGNPSLWVSLKNIPRRTKKPKKNLHFQFCWKSSIPISVKQFPILILFRNPHFLDIC